jgi:hypothetical protein
MSAIRPKFLPVLRDDAERVGVEAAYLLALVRYVTDLPGEHNGRIWIDGQMWWEATYPEIAEALGGLGRDKVGRIIRKLESDGELASRQPDVFDGNQTKAYRIAEQPICRSARQAEARANLHDPRAPVHDPRANLHDPPCKSAHSSSSTEELSEETEETDDRASQAIARRGGDRDLVPGPIYEDEHEIHDGQFVDEDPQYRAMRHAREASKRSDGEAETIGDVFDRVLGPKRGQP